MARVVSYVVYNNGNNLWNINEFTRYIDEITGIPCRLPSRRR